MINADEFSRDNRDKGCLSKLSWRSEEEAAAAGTYAAYQYGQSSTRPRPYKCKDCSSWHLASSYERK